MWRLKQFLDVSKDCNAIIFGVSLWQFRPWRWQHCYLSKRRRSHASLCMYYILQSRLWHVVLYPVRAGFKSRLVEWVLRFPLVYLAFVRLVGLSVANPDLEVGFSISRQRERSGRGMMLTTHLHRMPGLWISGALPLVSGIRSRPGQGQLYFFVSSCHILRKLFAGYCNTRCWERR
jgi:hypothetical protein